MWKSPQIHVSSIRRQTSCLRRKLEPEDAHLMRIGSHRHTKCSGKPKVSQFYCSLGIDQQVLWFEVTVQHTMWVAEGKALQKLEQVALGEEGEVQEGWERIAAQTRKLSLLQA